MPVEIAYIGLGSNLGEPIAQIKRAISDIGKIRLCELTETSSLYQTSPVGNIEQDDFINAMVAIKTRLTPMELLIELQSIEQAHYRVREPDNHWGPRTLDLDIILFGQIQVNDSHLTIPHRELQNRLFVLQPLLEIIGDLYLPGLGSLQYLVQNAPKTRVQIVAPKVVLS